MKQATYQRSNQGMLWPALAILFCTAFGIAHLLNVFTTGDGLWYWYAVAFNQGQRLYADLHLNLQPFFILMTSLSLHLFGRSWLGFHVFPAIQVALYTVGLGLVARSARWTGARRALLIVAAFIITITIHYYRFDDFHVTTQILQVYSLWLLLRLHRQPARTLWIAAALGILAGISVSNRLNDGVALVAASTCALFGIAIHRRWTALATFAVATSAAFLAVILSTGDSFRDWYHYTVVEAARIKGGSSHILLYPLTLPVRIVTPFLQQPHQLVLVGYSFLLAACLAAVPVILLRFRGTLRLALLAGTAAVFLADLPHVWKTVLQGLVNLNLANLGVPLLYLLFLLVVVRVIQALRHGSAPWNSLLLLFLIPLFQMFLAAITGGAGIVETTPALGLMLLLVPVVLPVPTERTRQNFLHHVPKDFLVALLVLMSIAGTLEKALYPFHWHHFYSDALFQNRTWYRHPVYGPMYIETRQLAFILPVCQTIAQNPGTGLLSAPYPQANYFCNIPPWHGYIQTWYDTSSRATIETLTHELATAPPTWVFYERSVPTLHAHEVVYTNQERLPHRALDELITGRIESLQWTTKQQQCFGGADWMLLRTSPPQPGEHTAFPVLMGNDFNLCSYTQYALIH